MQLGFVIDHSRCIGCHACTVACKAENGVPLGSFRTWVKYTEEGAFPEVNRSFAVLRCNQCSEAPCVTICPVRALEKRPDGIVDVDPSACIGCKACMQGCPYDALYIDDASGTAEKCHFCAHRVEVGLAPACAVVCPTEAIVPGDFHDPASTVSRLREEHDLTARKVEAGTGPNVLYREVGRAGIDPLATDDSSGYLWADRLPGSRIAARDLEVLLDDADRRARTTYDIDRDPPWGRKVSSYMLTKSLAAGIFLVFPALPLPPAPRALPVTTIAVLSLFALVFLSVTVALLVADLGRPGRFAYVMSRPNRDSWLFRGALVLTAYAAVLSLWTVALPFGPPSGALGAALLAAGIPLAALSAAYTGWLFGQARGRVLWMRRGLWLHLIVQALVAGPAFALLVNPLLALPRDSVRVLRAYLVIALAFHLLFVALETRMAPSRRGDEYRRAVHLVTRGPFAARHYGLGVATGILLPALLALLGPPLPVVLALASGFALVGLFVEDDILVLGGQTPRIS